MTLRIWGAAMVVAALIVWTAPAAAQPKELPATVVTLTGKAELYKKGDTRWNPADLRNQLNEGDGLRTGPGVRATLRTAGGHAIRLAALGQVFLVSPPQGAPEPQPVRVRLDRGWLWVAVTPGIHAQAPMEVSAGPARVAVRDGGIGFRLNRDGSVLVRTHHGLAVVRSSDPSATWERNLPEQVEVLVPPSGPPAENRKITRELAENNWALWNEEQDYVAYGGKAPQR
ncbi:MAG TPA: FecR domain-containing protein [Methylomirabilota bacterium]